MEELDRVIGIDLGTTNSCVAIVDEGVPQVIPNRGGYKTTPSMVAITEAGKRLVGHIAKRQAITNAENTVYTAKRLIGRKWDSGPVKNACQTVSYEIVEGPHGDVRIKLRDNLYSVQEISAMILQEMKIIAEEARPGEEISKAVITVPAYFNDGQRQATKDAGQIAGLDVIRIINEPTAAALAYGYGKDLDKLIAVFDLGGGTFDISILEIGEGGVFKVVATAGDTFLGGEDFDGRVIDWLVDSFREENSVDLRDDRMALQRLKDAAEKAKCELSGVGEADINLPFIISVGRSNEALHLQRSITREQLETLCKDLVDRCIEICNGTLQDAQLEAHEVDEVVLVGGMTRMPLVQLSAAEFFGREPCKGVHPDEVVAIGAAIQGMALVDETEDLILLDVTPHALGVMTYGKNFEELIAQNTTVPTSQTKTFTTSRDNQTAVKILVMQHESIEATDQLLGEFILTGLRSAQKGQVEIEVTFAIDSDGIVSVSAKDLETGIEQSIQVTASSGLTPEEIEEMMENAEEYMVDRKQSDGYEAVEQQAEKLIADVEKLFPEVEKIVASSDFGREAIGKARGVLTKTKQSLDDKELSALKEHIEALSRTLRMFKGVVSRTSS